MKEKLIKLSRIIGFAIPFILSYALGVNLIVPLILVVLYICLRTWERKNRIAKHPYLKLLLLFLVIFAIGWHMHLKDLNIIFIPYAIVSMLSILLWQNMVVTLLVALATNLSLAFVFNSLDVAILFLVASVLSCLLLPSVRRRAQIVSAGFIIGLAQVITWLILRNFQILPELNAYIILFINGVVCAIIVTGVLPVFEYLFTRITNISLLELADFNHPLLRRMMLEASGTYHHSLIVGNLSEVASEAIGANALLARIGAYYHDIGKLEKPEYFSENQPQSLNKHDSLSPSMSKLIIVNHVKEGETLARKYKLNQAIIDFIRQHHGTSLVYYFYQRALVGERDRDAVKEEGFRYPGPRPKTKETAIVLLADSVEAGVRALKNPSANRIEEMVHQIINNKFIDGQLDECDLSLKELEKIADCFIHLLSSMYHTRVVYPQGSSEDLYRKSTK
ncbi:MAG: HDIG domain-containing protein [Candidatus Omnitrophica bacterium]|nr:HDIG domain-containing protein [Candidatus Omnitrophota bacterium]